MILQISGVWAVGIDFVVWLIVHIGASYWVARKPIGYFNPESRLFRTRHWETDKKTYQRLLAIKKWKELLPDGAAVSKSGFRKKRLRSADVDYIKTFILETCRAELTHWLIFGFAFIFFIWNEWWIGMIMVSYGILANFPCIITQRYNRVRLKRYLSVKSRLIISANV